MAANLHRLFKGLPPAAAFLLSCAFCVPSGWAMEAQSSVNLPAALMEAYQGTWQSSIPESPLVTIRVCAASFSDVVPGEQTLAAWAGAQAVLVLTTEVKDGEEEQSLSYSSTLAATLSSSDERSSGVTLKTFGLLDKSIRCDGAGQQVMLNRASLAASRCQMQFKFAGSHWYGKTASTGCPSSYMGAERLVAEDWMFPDKLLTWERWYGADGAQVAGLEDGPMVFRRVD